MRKGKINADCITKNILIHTHTHTHTHTCTRIHTHTHTHTLVFPRESGPFSHPKICFSVAFLFQAFQLFCTPKRGLSFDLLFFLLNCCCHFPQFGNYIPRRKLHSWSHDGGGSQLTIKKSKITVTLQNIQKRLYESYKGKNGSKFVDSLGVGTCVNTPHLCLSVHSQWINVVKVSSSSSSSSITLFESRRRNSALVCVWRLCYVYIFPYYAKLG